MLHVHVSLARSLKTVTVENRRREVLDVFQTFFGRNMIKGHGIDLQEISAIEKAFARHAQFANRILTENELQRFLSLKGRRQIEYLAGRWAAKEALAKAMGVGIGQLKFTDIEILTDQKGAPQVTQSPVEDKVWLSISHSGDFVQASVILEDRDDC